MPKVLKVWRQALAIRVIAFGFWILDPSSGRTTWTIKVGDEIVDQGVAGYNA